MLDLVREQFFGAEVNEDDSTAVGDLAAVADKNADDVDPMDALDDVASNVGNSTVKTTRKRMARRPQVRELATPE